MLGRSDGFVVTDRAARRVDMVDEVLRVREAGPSRERLLARVQLIGFRGVSRRLALARWNPVLTCRLG